MTGTTSARTRTIIPLLAAAAALVATGGCSEISDADIKQVKISEVRTLTLRQAEKPESRLVVFIDPRAKARYDIAHLPGARNLKLPQVAEKSGIDPAIAAYDHIIVYGTDPGNAAASAMTKRMMSVGYDHVRLFAGGITEWVQAGYAVESTPTPAPDPAPPPAGQPY
jgi:3-mercaptopyruvate sulfurtransferase SseA